MSDLKVRIFDAVKRSGQDGITSSDLASIAFADRQRLSRPTRAISAHISQINDSLQATDWRIRQRSFHYRLVKETKP